MDNEQNNKPPMMVQPKPFQMLPSHWTLIFMVFLLLLFILLAGLNIYNWHIVVKIIFAILEIVGAVGFIACKTILDREYINELEIN